MTLDRLIGRIALIGGVALSSYTCDSTDSPSCMKDSDCKGERLCEKNVCVEGKTSSQAKYTCETACQKIIFDCNCSSAHTQKSYNSCVIDDCGGKNSIKGPWTQEKINYISSLSCQELNKICNN